MGNVFDWNPEIAKECGIPADFEPSEAELLMIDHVEPRLSGEEVRQLQAMGREGQDALVDLVMERHKRVWNARNDPYRHGWNLPHWDPIKAALQTHDEIFVFGANDSAKTKFLARIAVHVLFRRIRWPGMAQGPVKVLCVAQNDNASKQIQQSAIYEELPVEARRWNDRKKKSRDVGMKLNYSVSDGFTGSGFVLGNPRGSQCFFRTVAQWRDGTLSFEGAAYHLVCIDESMPMSMLQALQFRAGKSGGKILFCFTSINGFDSICKNVLTGATVEKSLPIQSVWLSLMLLFTIFW